ncbi:tetratricopeptide repeat protein [Hyunsoonleella flava]|uniref:Tetratricopeptide repeat protein n=1 Tax=Hyunsoonleella flava TaxID=2527939 RepID=A0A4Q9FKZ8_9FLAO|nr:tetratricopeptide repeat protein [Hyunsoonleella flava]TBN05508.1 tetratricopeptide repeat protein [Hyunsoonleella flava]
MKENDNISEELLETIERYLNGTLSTPELKDFNRLLDLDEDFRAQVEDVRTMLFGIEAQSLKEQLNEFHEDVPKATTKERSPEQKVRFLRYSRIAAAAAIIIAVGSIWFFSTPQNEKLYANYFKPDPGLPTTMSSTNNYDFYEAMVDYKHGDYQDAIDKWTVLAEEKPENDTINYFLGIAYMANRKEAQAIPFLERTVEAPDNFKFLDDAYYYLGLAYLKAGNLELAKKNLSLSKSDKAKEVVLKLTD